MRKVDRDELKQEMERLNMFSYTVLMIDDDSDFTEEIGVRYMFNIIRILTDYFILYTKDALLICMLRTSRKSKT